MRMRRHLKILSFLTLSVALLFGIRELPELMSLADDVSNDGEVIELVAVPVSVNAASRPDDREFTAQAAVLQDLPRFRTYHFSPVFPLRTGRSLIKLLSLLRV